VTIASPVRVFPVFVVVVRVTSHPELLMSPTPFVFTNPLFVIERVCPSISMASSVTVLPEMGVSNMVTWVSVALIRFLAVTVSKISQSVRLMVLPSV